MFDKPAPKRAVRPVVKTGDGGNLVDEVLAAPKGDRHNTINRCAFIAGGLGTPSEDEMAAAAVRVGDKPASDERKARAAYQDGARKWMGEQTRPVADVPSLSVGGLAVKTPSGDLDAFEAELREVFGDGVHRVGQPSDWRKPYDDAAKARQSAEKRVEEVTKANQAAYARIAAKRDEKARVTVFSHNGVDYPVWVFDDGRVDQLTMPWMPAEVRAKLDECLDTMTAGLGRRQRSSAAPVVDGVEQYRIVDGARFYNDQPGPDVPF